MVAIAGEGEEAKRDCRRDATVYYLSDSTLRFPTDQGRRPCKLCITA
ncbi:MAG: hypothetical protein GX364_05740 [Firmicutes bacterium]|nr:hypothetical protein [Bacillota bacterium]